MEFIGFLLKLKQDFLQVKIAVLKGDVKNLNQWGGAENFSDWHIPQIWLDFYFFICLYV